MSDDEIVYPPSVDVYINTLVLKYRGLYRLERHVKTIIPKIQSLFRQAEIDVPEDLDYQWIRRQRKHRNQKKTTNRRIPDYVDDCIDRHWDKDKEWPEVSDDVRNTILEKIKALYKKNGDEPNENPLGIDWIRRRRLSKNYEKEYQQKCKTDPIFNAKRKATRAKSENKRIQREFDGDRKAFLSSNNKKRKGRQEERPELVERSKKKAKEKYASDRNHRERTLERNLANIAKRQIEIKTILAKDPTTRTVQDVAKLDKAAYERMKGLRRAARRRMARKVAKDFHKGIFVRKYKKVIYSTYSTLYMSGFDELDEFSDFICKDMEKYDWAIEKHGTALQALFHQDEDTTQTFEIDEIFACHMFDNTPEHQVALWHFSNTQVLTSSQNNAKSKKSKRTKAFLTHIETVNDWYRDHEEHAFKVVVSNIASQDKVRNVLKSKSPVTSHVPESSNESAWIDWYDKLDPGKNNYREKVKKLEKGSKNWLRSYIKQVNDY